MDMYSNRIWRRRQIVVANPAINVFGNQNCPSGVMWRLSSILFGLTTVPSTGAAFAQFQLATQTSTIFEWDSATDVGVNKTGYFYGGRETGSVYINAGEPAQNFPFPDILLYPTDGVTVGWWSNTGDVQVALLVVTVDEALLGY